MIFADLNDILDQAEYRRQSAQLSKLAGGDYSPIKTELARKYPRSDLEVRAIPFVERYVSELSGLYKRPIVRRFRGVSADAQWQKLTAVYEASGVNAALSKAEDALWVQNTVILFALPDGLGRVSLQMLQPWQVDSIEVDDAMRADDPRHWTKLVADVPSSSVRGQVITSQLEMTPTHAWRYIGANRVGIYSEDGSHPFGAIPVVVVRRKTPQPGRPLAAFNEAVLNLQVSLSLQAADDESIVRNCAFPQKVIRNATIAQQVEEITVGPDKVIALVRSGNPDDPAPELGVVQGQVPVSELVTHAEHKIRMYCAMLGLDPSAFLRVNTAVTASARVFSAQDRKALRDLVLPELAKMETEVARMVVAVLALREPMAMPDGLTVEVRYSMPEPEPDPRTAAEAHRERVALGLDSRSAIVARERGIGAAAALAAVKRNLAENRDLTASPEPPPQLDPPPAIPMNGAANA